MSETRVAAHTESNRAIDFRPLSLTIDALTIDGKAVTKALWDQIPEIRVGDWQDPPVDVTLLGWVNMHSSLCKLHSIHRHFIAVRDGRPLRVAITEETRGQPDGDALRALGDIARCWQARQHAGNDTPPFAWLRKNGVTRDPLIPHGSGWGPQRWRRSLRPLGRPWVP